MEAVGTILQVVKNNKTRREYDEAVAVLQQALQQQQKDTEDTKKDMANLREQWISQKQEREAMDRELKRQSHDLEGRLAQLERLIAQESPKHIPKAIDHATVPSEEIQLQIGGNADTHHDPPQASASKSKNHYNSLVSKALFPFDRWGEPIGDPMQKSVVGGVFGIFLLVALGFYAVMLYIGYDEQPAIITTNLLWSKANGPYPMIISCYAQHCLVSLELGSVTNTSTGCLAKLDQAQLNRCIRLGKGEQIVLQTCYSLLPTQGVHVTVGGPHAWLELRPDLHRDLGFDVMNSGFAIVSETPRGLLPVPILRGRTSLDYLVTENRTIPDGSDGAQRHEWFAQFISDEAPSFPIQTCTALRDEIGDRDNISSSGPNSWKLAFVHMNAAYTKIEVDPAPDFIATAIGEVGGALEIGEQAILVVLLIFFRVSSKLTPVQTVATASAVPSASAAQG